MLGSNSKHFRASPKRPPTPVSVWAVVDSNDGAVIKTVPLLGFVDQYYQNNPFYAIIELKGELR